MRPAYALTALLLALALPPCGVDTVEAQTNRRGSLRPQSEPRSRAQQKVSINDLKLAVNAAFMASQTVAPETRAEGLRQLAQLVSPIDSSRALWLYDHAFRGAQVISPAAGEAARERVQLNIITDESKLDLPQAVTHLMEVEDRSEKKEDGSTTEREASAKHRVLMDLMKRIPPEDPEGLFTRLSNMLVREDDNYSAVQSMINFYLGMQVARGQHLFSEAMIHFQSRPTTASSLNNFAALTSLMSRTNTSLALQGVELILEKARSLDESQRPATSFTLNPPVVMGEHERRMTSQFLPLLNQYNPDRAKELLERSRGGDLRNRTQTNSPRPPQPAQRSPNPQTDRSVSSPPSLRGTGVATSNPRATSGAMVARTAEPSLRDARLRPLPESAPIPLEVEMRAALPSSVSMEINQALLQIRESFQSDPEAAKKQSADLLTIIRQESSPRARSIALSRLADVYAQIGDEARSRELFEESLDHAVSADAARSTVLPGGLETGLQRPSVVSEVLLFLADSAPATALEKAQQLNMDAALKFRVLLDLSKFFASRTWIPR